MKGFKRDLSKWREYDFVVINDDLKKCYSKIMFAIRNKIYSISVTRVIQDIVIKCKGAGLVLLSQKCILAGITRIFSASVDPFMIERV